MLSGNYSNNPILIKWILTIVVIHTIPMPFFLLIIGGTFPVIEMWLMLAQELPKLDSSNILNLFFLSPVMIAYNALAYWIAQFIAWSLSWFRSFFLQTILLLLITVLLFSLVFQPVYTSFEVYSMGYHLDHNTGIDIWMKKGIGITNLYGYAAFLFILLGALFVMHCVLFLKTREIEDTY